MLMYPVIHWFHYAYDVSTDFNFRTFSLSISSILCSSSCPSSSSFLHAQCLISDAGVHHHSISFPEFLVLIMWAPFLILCCIFDHEHSSGQRIESNHIECNWKTVMTNTHTCKRGNVSCHIWYFILMCKIFVLAVTMVCPRCVSMTCLGI